MNYVNSLPSYSKFSLLRRAMWNIVYFLLFRYSPWFAFSWRNFLLALFGARIEKGVRVYPSARIFNPLRLHLCRYSSVGPGTYLYNHALIKIGDSTVVSQNVTLCTGSHDFRDSTFPLISSEIIIDSYCWLCADCFIGPGVSIGDHSVLGARSVLFKSIGSNQVWVGNPAELISSRGRA